MINIKISIAVMSVCLFTVTCKKANDSVKNKNTSPSIQNPITTPEKQPENDFIKTITGIWCAPAMDLEELETQKKSKSYLIKKDTCDDTRDAYIITLSDIEKKDTYFIVKTASFDVTKYYKEIILERNLRPASIIILSCTETALEFFINNNSHSKFSGTFSSDKRSIYGYWENQKNKE